VLREQRVGPEKGRPYHGRATGQSRPREGEPRPGRPRQADSGRWAVPSGEGARVARARLATPAPAASRAEPGRGRLNQAAPPEWRSGPTPLRTAMSKFAAGRMESPAFQFTWTPIGSSNSGGLPQGARSRDGEVGSMGGTQRTGVGVTERSRPGLRFCPRIVAAL